MSVLTRVVGTTMIPLNECVDRGIYLINSRNLRIGVYVATRQAFIGIRKKFGDRYLFAEFHYECGPPYGTVRPQTLLAAMPENGIQLVEGWQEDDAYWKNARLFDFMDACETLYEVIV